MQALLIRRPGGFRALGGKCCGASRDRVAPCRHGLRQWTAGSRELVVSSESDATAALVHRLHDEPDRMVPPDLTVRHARDAASSMGVRDVHGPWRGGEVLGSHPCVCRATPSIHSATSNPVRAARPTRFLRSSRIPCRASSSPRTLGKLRAGPGQGHIVGLARRRRPRSAILRLHSGGGRPLRLGLR